MSGIFNQKLLKSDNWFSSYSQKCQGCFLRPVLYMSYLAADFKCCHNQSYANNCATIQKGLVYRSICPSSIVSYLKTVSVRSFSRACDSLKLKRSKVRWMAAHYVSTGLECILYMIYQSSIYLIFACSLSYFIHIQY